MKQWVSIRFKFYSCVKGVQDQRIIIAISDSECDDPSVVEIQNGTQVHLVDLDANVILEFCYIGKPFLIWSICMKVPF